MIVTPRHLIAIGLISAGVLSLAGCGSSASHPAAKASPTVHSAHSTIPAGNNGKLVHPAGAIADLSGFKCQPNASGSWTASGVVTNTSTRTQQYILDFSVINKADTVVGTVRRQFPVAAGHRVSAHAEDFFRSTVHGLRCLPRLVSGTS